MTKATSELTAAFPFVLPSHRRTRLQKRFHERSRFRNSITSYTGAGPSLWLATPPFLFVAPKQQQWELECHPRLPLLRLPLHSCKKKKNQTKKQLFTGGLPTAEGQESSGLISKDHANEGASSFTWFL